MTTIQANVHCDDGTVFTAYRLRSGTIMVNVTASDDARDDVTLYLTSGAAVLALFGAAYDALALCDDRTPTDSTDSTDDDAQVYVESDDGEPWGDVYPYQGCEKCRHGMHRHAPGACLHCACPLGSVAVSS